MNQNCQASSIVYEATLTSDNSNDEGKKYLGLCEQTYKKRYGTHKASFTHERYKNNTTLSKEFWKEKHHNASITWRFVSKESACTPESDRCPLCLQEKYEIANYPGQAEVFRRKLVIG